MGQGLMEEITGECGECGAPCTDRDLVACWYWCGVCINRALDEDPPPTEMPDFGEFDA
jgi:hypothetical protein